MEVKYIFVPLLLLVCLVCLSECHFFRPHGERASGDPLGGLRNTLQTIDSNFKASVEQVKTNIAHRVQQTHLTLGALLGHQRTPTTHQHHGQQPPSSPPLPQYVHQPVTDVNDHHRYEEHRHEQQQLVEVTEIIINPHESFDVRSNFVLSDEDLTDTNLATLIRTSTTPPTPTVTTEPDDVNLNWV